MNPTVNRFLTGEARITHRFRCDGTLAQAQDLGQQQ